MIVTLQIEFRIAVGASSRSWIPANRPTAGHREDRERSQTRAYIFLFYVPNTRSARVRSSGPSSLASL